MISFPPSFTPKLKVSLLQTNFHVNNSLFIRKLSLMENKAINELHQELEKLKNLKAEAVKMGKYELAANYRDREKKLILAIEEKTFKG